MAFAFGAWAVMVGFLFVRPARDHPRRVDAIAVLSGDLKHRLPTALALAREGVARILVVSDGERSSFAPARELCEHPARQSFRVVCFRPSPFSTRGEARGLREMIARRGWHSLLVVTSTFHVYRARMLFERCLEGSARVYVDGTRSSRLMLPRDWVSETFKLGLALTARRSC